jgi:hypothetical protein
MIMVTSWVDLAKHAIGEGHIVAAVFAILGVWAAANFGTRAFVRQRSWHSIWLKKTEAIRLQLIAMDRFFLAVEALSTLHKAKDRPVEDRFSTYEHLVQRLNPSDRNAGEVGRLLQAAFQERNDSEAIVRYQQQIVTGLRNAFQTRLLSQLYEMRAARSDLVLYVRNPDEVERFLQYAGREFVMLQSITQASPSDSFERFYKRWPVIAAEFRSELRRDLERSAGWRSRAITTSYQQKARDKKRQARAREIKRELSVP